NELRKIKTRREKLFMKEERTLIIFKPDAIEKGVVEQIKQRIMDAGFKILKSKPFRFTKELAREHYWHVRNIPVFEEMLEFMTSKDVIVMVAEKENAISDLRKLIGPTRNAPPGTIRGDYGSDGYRNLIHASDSPENA